MTVETIETPTDWLAAERPADLTPGESDAYRKGYGKGVTAYVRKFGGPGVTHEDKAPAAGSAARVMLGRELAAMARAHESDRHPAAHKAGLAELRRYRIKNGIPLPTPVRKPRATRTAGAKVTTIAAPAPAPVAPVVAPVDTTREGYAARAALRRARKVARRELAAQMRADGVDITPESWRAAKASVPVLADEVTGVTA